MLSDYQQFIALSRYARWQDDLGRRETWSETVDRYIDFVGAAISIPHSTLMDLRSGILDHLVMPSMRALMTAGEALRRDNTASFNCSYVAVDGLRAFDEAMFILLCGTGVGFSVERQFVSQLPTIPSSFSRHPQRIVVEDSKEGWARALRELIARLYAGHTSRWDISLVRPKGARLKTFGGRASGPEPLVELFEFVTRMVVNAAGRKLTSIEAHDIMCKIGEIVVVGGVRRSAMISLSNLSDDRMRHAKSGQWWETAPHRALANNSVAYTERPDMEVFMREWLALVESKSGERGIFSRPAAQRQAARFGRRSPNCDYGTNPCGEILLRSKGLCNLSEIVARADDNINDLKEKARLAAILGTIQSTFTYFPYLSDEWKQNAEEERLLGVSLTGIMDCSLINGTVARDQLPGLLTQLREHVVATNIEWANEFGISPSAATTCVKPSGTVSQLVDSSSGIHARHSDYYIRTVRGDNKDPMTQFMADAGIPAEACVMKPDTTTVFSFPQKAPEGAITRNEMSAIEQLELWQLYQQHYCEHNPSVTVTVRDHEWLKVGAFVYDNLGSMTGVSFLPHSDHSYRQAPYQECDRETYEVAQAKMPSAIDWSLLSHYETDDRTSGTQTLACSAGVCELVDI